jgi:hypothetical protein
VVLQIVCLSACVQLMYMSNYLDPFIFLILSSICFYTLLVVFPLLHMHITKQTEMSLNIYVYA